MGLFDDLHEAFEAILHIGTSNQQKQQDEWNQQAEAESDSSDVSDDDTSYQNPNGYYASATGGYSASSSPTEAQQQAADNLKNIMYFNSDSIKRQNSQMNENYDRADRQNRALADVENKQNSRKAASERFAANKKLQAALHGLLGAAGNALNGSANHELLDMINTRTDLDNNEAWQSLTQNRNTVENAYQEALNQNVLARHEAAINAEYALRNLEAGVAADLNNINPELYEEPGEGGASAWAEGWHERGADYPDNLAQLSGYIMPDNAKTTADTIQQPNKLGGNSYYSRLINQYNQSRR